MSKNRPYQTACINAVEAAFVDYQSVLAECPTGTGKSRIFSELVRRAYPKRSLILAHRGELIFQAARHIQNCGLETAIEKADLVASNGLFNRSPVVVASVQTMVSKERSRFVDRKRMQKWLPTDFGLIVCDEAHHFCAPIFREVLDYFKKGNPSIRIFGCTATPDRADEKALGTVFDMCAFRLSILDAINQGWLVPICPLSLRVDDMDLSHIKTTAGDLNQGELAKVMELEKPLYGMAQAALESAFYMEPNSLTNVPVEQWHSFLTGEGTPPRSTLCFTVSVKQSEMLSDIFNRVIPNVADWVCGKTETESRHLKNEAFKSGALPILVNCGTHTEGVDVPRAEVIVPKPTKSRSLCVQMIGRGFRPAEVNGKSIVDQYETAEERIHAIGRSRKPQCIVIDLYGTMGKHKLVSPLQVLGGNYDEQTVERAVQNARAKMVAVNVTEEMEAAKQQLLDEAAEARARAAARRSRLVGRATFAVGVVNPFDNSDVSPMKMPARTGAMLSDAQKWIIRVRLGKDPDKLPIGYAKKLIGEYFKNRKR